MINGIMMNMKMNIPVEIDGRSIIYHSIIMFVAVKCHKVVAE